MGKQNDIIVVLLYELRNHVQLLLRLNLSMKNLLHNNRSRRSWPKTATFSLATNRNLPSRARSDNVPIQGYVTPKTPPWRSQAGLVYTYGKRSDLVNTVLMQLDFHPLSITLLATVAHQNTWDDHRLASEWNKHRAGVLQT